ncbi:MAG: divergent polysaccharide deacetylase family protein, partial [Pseudomonadota bacterium]
MGLFLIVLSNQMMDRRVLSFPQPEAEPVEVPAGTEFDQARPETDPVIPETDTRPGPGTLAGVQAPQDLGETPPSFDTSSLQVPTPSLDGPGTLGSAPEPTDGPVLGANDTTESSVAVELPWLQTPSAPTTAPEPTTEAPATAEPEVQDDAPVVADTVEDMAPNTDGVDDVAMPADDDAEEAPSVVTDVTAPQAPTLAPVEAPLPEVADSQNDVTLPAAQDEQIAAGPSENAFTRFYQPSAPSTEDDVIQLGAPSEPEAADEERAPLIIIHDAADDDAAEDEQVVEEIVAEAVEEEIPAPVAVEEDVAEEAPQVVEQPELPQVPEEEPEPEQAIVLEAPEGGDNDDVMSQAEADVGDDVAQLDTVGTLPTIRRLPGQPVEDDIEEPTADTAEAEEEIDLDGPAMQVWRMTFEDPGDKPLVSVVLVHSGGVATVQDVANGTPSTVAIAVNAADTDAQAVARAYRDEGREVVLIPALPESAAPQDVEVALQANFDTISEAVAVMDSTGETFQADRNAVAQVVDVIADTGHGLITFPRGLNTAFQSAEREGVPAGLVFRDIDGTGQSSDQIARALDRAAFRARPEE